MIKNLSKELVDIWVDIIPICRRDGFSLRSLVVGKTLLGQLQFKIFLSMIVWEVK